MRCLPYKATKINLRHIDISGVVVYRWFHQDSKLMNSFNDQPATKASNGSLSWAKEDLFFRECNKPTHILRSIEALHFKDSDRNHYKPLTDEDVHPDYREQWREWHQDLAK